MPRLFVAADFPDFAVARLAELHFPKTAGVRQIPLESIHLTLHFIGEAAVEPLAEVLQFVSVPAFRLTIEGVGKFRSINGGAVLWAGIQESVELLQFHAAVGAALSTTGYKPEKRRYKPHITLARCRPDLPPRIISKFLDQYSGLCLPDIPIRSFGLYSSVTASDGPVYRCEKSYPLLMPDQQGNAEIWVW